MNKKFLTTAICLAATIATTASACTFHGVKGSGKPTTRTLSVPAFDEVSASRAVKVVLIEGTAHELTIKADDNLIDHITVRVEDGELIIGIDSKIKSASNISATVTVPTDGRIKSLDASSAAEIRTQNLILTAAEIDIDASSAAAIDVQVKAAKLDIDASSASQIRVGATTDECTVEASSAAKIILQGSASRCKAALNSAAELKAAKLVAADYVIKVSSGASASILCTGNLDAYASSGGSITYTGDCTVEAHPSSGGSIHKTK